MPLAPCGCMNTASDDPTTGAPSIERTKGFHRGYEGKSMRIDHTRLAGALISICVSIRCIDEGLTDPRLSGPARDAKL